MEVAGFTDGVIRFGAFEVDLRARELRKRGLRVRLQEQPFQVLAVLLERPGEVVTRDELARRLWADGTVVDYEGGLNAALTRLRQALSDSAEAPRYVETIARRGYRFIAQVERAEEAGATSVAPVSLAARPRQFSKPIVVAAVTLAAGGMGALAWSIVHAHRDKPAAAVSVTPLTVDVGVERNASFSPDGTQVVYEWETEDHRRHIYVKVVGPGDPIALTSGTSVEFGPAWSPDGRLIAFLRQTEPTTVGLYVVPPLGGVERKLADAAAPGYWVLHRFVRRLAWTVDSSRVIVSVPDRFGHGEGLLSVSVADGGKTWLTDPKAEGRFGDREPAVSRMDNGSRSRAEK